MGRLVRILADFGVLGRLVRVGADWWWSGQDGRGMGRLMGVSVGW